MYLLKPKPALLNLISQLNNYPNEQNNENNQNMLDCKCKNLESWKSLSLFHINICSLQKNFDNFLFCLIGKH